MLYLKACRVKLSTLCSVFTAIVERGSWILHICDHSSHWLYHFFNWSSHRTKTKNRIISAPCCLHFLVVLSLSLCIKHVSIELPNPTHTSSCLWELLGWPWVQETYDSACCPQFPPAVKAHRTQRWSLGRRPSASMGNKRVSHPYMISLCMHLGPSPLTCSSASYPFLHCSRVPQIPG